MLNLILEEHDAMVWIEFDCLTMGPSGGHLWTRFYLEVGDELLSVVSSLIVLFRTA